VYDVRVSALSTAAPAAKMKAFPLGDCTPGRLLQPAARGATDGNTALPRLL